MLMVDRVFSAGAAITFVGLIQCKNPPAWALGALAVGLYEVLMWSCRIARSGEKKTRKKHYITMTMKDMHRVEAQRFKEA